jgi:hypothetical protein
MCAPFRLHGVSVSANQSSLFQQFLASSAFSGANASYIGDLYEAFLADPASVPAGGRDAFPR